jgi:hypothetical protein
MVDRRCSLGCLSSSGDNERPASLKEGSKRERGGDALAETGGLEEK